ncbi:MAG: hypothetical protein M1819_003950 [Sarea resinae]|nr:MAG: hypothetical protein M1819_003950 [Sarea resinae]
MFEEHDHPDRGSWASVDGRRPSSPLSNPNVFSDEFALEPLEVSDGFMPRSMTEDDNPSAPVSHLTDNNATARTSFSPTSPPQSPQKPPRPSKSSKGHAGHDSFALQHDGSTGSLIAPQPSSVATNAAASHPAVPPPRPMSIASSFNIPRTQSPYQGATGPSHPYAMYPQGIGMARSPSIATTSTIRAPERSFQGPNGPAHPYGMYPQNTLEEGEPAVVPPQIPIGFPGLGQEYQRRLGPEGEEAADIIGPDGHTEQLPPYTRYPDVIPPKEVPEAPPNLNVPPQNAPGVSQDSLNSPQSPLAGSVISGSSNAELNTSQAQAAEGEDGDGTGNFKEKLTEKGKRRICWRKVPLWAVVLIVIVLVLLSVLTGGLVGGLVSRTRNRAGSHGPPPSSNATTSTSAASTVTVTAVDASAIATPSSLAALATGTFELPIAIPEESSSGCLTNSQQSDAWSCSLSDSTLQIHITSSNGNLPSMLTIDAEKSNDNVVSYGAQPPLISQPQRLGVVLDKDDPNRGPAYFFSTTYDKLVIVDESEISTSTPKRSTESTGEMKERQWDEGFPPPPPSFSFDRRNQDAHPGDKPWYCFWNSTVLEGFVYVSQDVSNTSASSSVAASSATSVVTATTSASTSASRSLSSSFSTSISSSASGIPATITSTSKPQKRQASSAPTSTVFPQLVKIEERRLSGDVQPYCQQMQVLDDGAVGLYTLPNGQPVTVNISESDPSQQNMVTESRLFKRDRRRRSAVDQSCFCQWLNT